MAVYTVQDLKDAYFAVTVTDPSSETQDNAYFAAEIVRIQIAIDARLAELEIKKTNMVDRGVQRASDIQARVDQIQARIDAIEPVAKEYMKDVALNYLAAEAKEASEDENEALSL
jgi:multidrug resistance efflux pump